MAGTGNGGAAAVEIAKAPTAAGSAPSTRRGRPRTRKTETVLGLGKRLEILEQAVIDYQAEGGAVELIDLAPGLRGVAITLKHIGYCPRCSRLVTGSRCPRCLVQVEGGEEENGNQATALVSD